MVLRAKQPQSESIERLVHVPADGVTLEGALVIPTEARGVVLFAHGSGSSRHSPRNNYVARVLPDGGLGPAVDRSAHRAGSRDVRDAVRYRPVGASTDRPHGVAWGAARHAAPRHGVF